jgi:signal transduction histidine kinase
MNLMLFSSILIFVTNFITAIFLFLTSHGRKINVIWAYFCLGVSIWGIGGYFGAKTSSPQTSIICWQLANIGAICCPVLFYHFVAQYLDKREKLLSICSCLLAGIFLFVNFFRNDLFFGNVSFMFEEFYFLDWTIQKGPFYVFFYIAFFCVLVLYAFFLALKGLKHTTGLRRNQLKYFILAMAIGFLGGHGDFLPVFGVPVYPVSNFLIAIYPLIIGYAIVRYRLMDISMAIARTGIFVAVYSMILGIPFLIGFQILDEGLWLVPISLMAVFATVGPFIYFYIERRAENALLKEQRQYQHTLREASIGMGRIKDLRRLLSLIVHIVTRTVRLEHTTIYLFDHLSGNFVLGATRSRRLRFKPQEALVKDGMIVETLKQKQNPILYEEIKQRTQDYGDRNLARLEVELKELDASLVVPSFVDDRLLAIISLGEKVSRKFYSEDDLAVFVILASQAALAIENAQFCEDMKKTHAQLFKAEKMATIGTMADGLSHQINNRLHALGFIASDILDTIRLKASLFQSDDLKEVKVDLEHALSRIQENIIQGGEIVRGLLKYTRKGDEGFSEVDLNHLLDAVMEMTQFKIKPNEMTVLREFGNIPKIKGNFTQLQEVFFNMIDNAYDAMMQRRTELKEAGYRPTIKVFAEANGHGLLNICIEDNGIGIQNEDKVKLFTPFFTTKLSSKKGTGLGLYVIQKLIEENHGGKVAYESAYRQGTRVRISLPACH